jgi:hypothetical protein
MGERIEVKVWQIRLCLDRSHNVLGKAYVFELQIVRLVIYATSLWRVRSP